MRIALGIEYLGERYMGWQRQHHGPSVQAELERALSEIAAQSIDVVCAGRTDTGVHALGQVVHFDTTAVRSDYNWLAGGNSRLPDDIAVRWVRRVADDFHARFNAIWRRYIYVIHAAAQRSVVNHGRVYRVAESLDVDAMHRAAQHFVGEHDFSSFRAAGCQSKSPTRNVSDAAVARHGSYIWFDVRANAFVQHMVRNMTGALISVGRGELSADAIGELLAKRDRTAAPFAAPPHGLYLWSVGYPAASGLVDVGTLNTDQSIAGALPLPASWSC
ncbi:MAG: tRNA pseudouridine(38-40) synthase TruA [Pseudomonadota bacterium]